MIYTEKILNYTLIYWNFDVKIPLISVLPSRMFTFQKGSLRNKQLSVNETLTLADSSARLKIIRLFHKLVCDLLYLSFVVSGRIGRISVIFSEITAEKCLIR